MTGSPAGLPVTLSALLWDWSDAYTIGYQHDQWIAARRDGRGTLRRPTLAMLDTATQTDYRTSPVPRAFDPPATSAGGRNDERPSDDESFLLTAMQEAFPAWAISYDTVTRSWTAQTPAISIRQPTAALLCAALAGAGRRAHRTSDPGPGPWSPPGTT
ncbi:MAG TPA: hypothetical protein VGI96_18050 [Streptosporangiaceae bacterium]|jgi:hypothetical protein